MRYSNRPKRIIRLTESDLTRIIRRVIKEEESTAIGLIPAWSLLPLPIKTALLAIGITKVVYEKMDKEGIKALLDHLGLTDMLNLNEGRRRNIWEQDEKKSGFPRPLGTQLKNMSGSGKVFDEETLKKLDDAGLKALGVKQVTLKGDNAFVLEIDDPKSDAEYLLVTRDFLPLTLEYVQRKNEAGDIVNFLSFLKFGPQQGKQNQLDTGRKELVRRFNDNAHEERSKDHESIKKVLNMMGIKIKPQTIKT